MSASALPSKLFFRIGEVAGLVGVEPHVLRYWEREFRSIRPTKSAKGQRVYSRKDVENLLRVRDLLYRDGFTIAGAKKRLQRGPATEASLAHDALAHDALAHDAPAPADARAVDADEQPDDPDDGDLALDEEAEEIAVVEPPSGPRSQLTHAHAEDEQPVREKLMTLRAEIEGFLLELETSEHP